MFFFYLITIISFIITYFLYKDAKTKFAFVATTIFLAGTIGNFIDRLLYKEVIDFFSFTFGSYNFAIFNVADIFITCGVVLLVIEHIYGYWKEKVNNGKV
jgi:signal peptidase II